MKTKRERQAETARMTRCACGNIARQGFDTCSRCDREAEFATDRENAMVAALQHQFGEMSERTLVLMQNGYRDEKLREMARALLAAVDAVP